MIIEYKRLEENLSIESTDYETTLEFSERYVNCLFEDFNYMAIALLNTINNIDVFKRNL